MMMTTTMRLLLCSRWFFSSEGLYDDDECESWFTLVRFQPKEAVGGGLPVDWSSAPSGPHCSEPWRAMCRLTTSGVVVVDVAVLRCYLLISRQQPQAHTR
uniref:Putative secreted protein n=1 Tax=Anopheles triannulatus TaxID=58253 RepID=A0A2M4B4P1_9DIPT